MSPLKDPLRIENVENPEEDNHNETIKTEHVVKTEVNPKSSLAVHGEWTCEVCGKKFGQGSNLDRHVRSVHKGEIVQKDVKLFCNICDKIFDREKRLKRHLEIIHEPKVAKKFIHEQKVAEKCKNKTCSECGKTFKRGLRKHIQQVHGEKNWKCEHCNADFTMKDNFQRHINKVHLGQVIQCDLCTYKAKEKKSILKHVKKQHTLDDLDKMTFVKKFDEKWSCKKSVPKEGKVTKKRYKKWFNHNAIIERFKAFSNL